MFLSRRNNDCTLVFQQNFIIKLHCIYIQLLHVIGNTNNNIIPDPKGGMFLFSKTLKGSMTVQMKTGLISKSEDTQLDSRLRTWYLKQWDVTFHLIECQISKCLKVLCWLWREQTGLFYFLNETRNWGSLLGRQFGNIHQEIKIHINTEVLPRFILTHQRKDIFSRVASKKYYILKN